MMPGVNYVIYGCFSARTTPGLSLYQSLALEKKILLQLLATQDRVIDDRKIKLKTNFVYLQIISTNLKFSIY